MSTIRSSENDLPDPRKILRSLGLSPKESLGQNFLINRPALEKIVDCLEIDPGELVLEIGPGLGHLTSVLARRAAQVVAIEKDERLYELCSSLMPKNVTVVHGDASKMALNELVSRHEGPFKVAGNLPFNQSVDILFNALDQLGSARKLVLMFQREVASRIVSPPCCKIYGSLSVLVWARTASKFCFLLQPGSFYPSPKVQASVVSFLPRKPAIFDERCLLVLKEIVEACFSNRRKTLSNALKRTRFSALLQASLPSGKAPWTSLRPENLSPEDYVFLADLYCREEEAMV